MDPRDKGITRTSRHYRKFARRATLIAILAILLPILWFSGNYTYQVIRTDMESDVLASEEDLIESFYLVAHTSDLLEPTYRFPVHKWGLDVSVYYHPSLTDWHRGITERQLLVLSKYSGINFRTTDRFDQNVGLSVFYAPFGMTAGEMAKNLGIDYDRIRLATCYAIHEWGDDGTNQWGHVVYSRPPEERHTETCIVEETIQVLGLPADRATYFPTVFTNDRVRSVALSINDKILLRALYDPAIKTGMSQEQTRTLIPGIIRRLVTGVKARGEQALYQN